MSNEIFVLVVCFGLFSLITIIGNILLWRIVLTAIIEVRKEIKDYNAFLVDCIKDYTDFLAGCIKDYTGNKDLKNNDKNI